MKDCVSCVHEHLSPMSDTCRECGIAMLNYEEAKPKPTTNADRIRSLSDDELAAFLQGVAIQGGIELGGRLTTWLDWLKQEAEE